MPKLKTAQKPYTMLVANLRQGSDPSKGVSGNPTKVRTGFTVQHCPQIARPGNEPSEPGDPSTPGLTTQMGRMTGSPTAATGTITVANNDFTAKAVLYLGPYTVTSGEDFTVGGSTALTAVALAAAIDGLPGFSASPSGSDVDVTVMGSLGGNDLQFEALFLAAITNYTLSPTTGRFSGGLPALGPPTLLA